MLIPVRECYKRLSNDEDNVGKLTFCSLGLELHVHGSQTIDCFCQENRTQPRPKFKRASNHDQDVRTLWV